MNEPKVKVIKAGKKGEYVALVGFNTSDKKRYEAGRSVSDLKPEDVKALLEMNAIRKAD